MMLFVAFTLVAAMVVMFVLMEYGNKHMKDWLGTPPPEVNEDDPELIEYLERKLRHLED